MWCAGVGPQPCGRLASHRLHRHPRREMSKDDDYDFLFKGERTACSDEYSYWGSCADWRLWSGQVQPAEPIHSQRVQPRVKVDDWSGVCHAYDPGVLLFPALPPFNNVASAGGDSCSWQIDGKQIKSQVCCFVSSRLLLSSLISSARRFGTLVCGLCAALTPCDAVQRARSDTVPSRRHTTAALWVRC